MCIRDREGDGLVNGAGAGGQASYEKSEQDRERFVSSGHHENLLSVKALSRAAGARPNSTAYCKYTGPDAPLIRR